MVQVVGNQSPCPSLAPHADATQVGDLQPPMLTIRPGLPAGEGPTRIMANWLELGIFAQPLKESLKGKVYRFDSSLQGMTT